ncbi:dihydroflavonol 4-reductase-like isoform X2 [Rhododendron vialii]|uniref:dihydroflavonol 4-reductase-like isoform X2 n=1 Tax=Rhododendron vialii TaxID=182163 RepID=UPI00265EA109|nr:dihydroflavonol 4-reductase-like isoform X2 [Rhododendron vialii]
MIPRQLTTVLHRASMLGDPKKMDHLLSLHGAKERLQLFEANLMEEGSFDSVVDGCEGVLHTASPVFLESSNPQLHYDTSSGFCFHYECAGLFLHVILVIQMTLIRSWVELNPKN